MQIRTNYETRRVLISGTDGSGAYRIELTWSQALNLGSLLIAESRLIEPPPPSGKCYSPKVGRWG